jgi:proteasome assembly chaperone (PAC2) family protein
VEGPGRYYVGESGNLVLETRPVLRKPYIVCGVNGWVNGGDVSTGGVRALIAHFKATKFAEMTTARYHVYQVPGVESLRPVFKMQDGLLVESELPRDQFFYALNPASDHDLILFLGNEPNLNWEEYADTVVNLAGNFGADRLYTFGGILDRSPYTRPPRISCTCSGPEVKSDMERYHVNFSSREGPASFNIMLLHACKKRGLGGANLTVRVPYYPEFNVAFDYSPKSIKAILVRLNHAMQLKMNFDDLDKSIGEIDAKFDLMRQQNPQFHAYVEELEKDYVGMPYEEPVDMSSHDAIRFAEEFLRENNDQRRGR